jgi:hypothetical protein
MNVSGLLDLATASDTLRLSTLGPPPTGVNSFILASYGTRIGEFDNVSGLLPGMSILYTSPSNAGPGQIVLQIVPEPSAIGVLSFGFLFLGSDRRIARRRGASQLT